MSENRELIQMSEDSPTEDIIEIEMEGNPINRPIEAITTEIIFYKEVGGNAILEIGHRLIEAKALLGHGEWLPWLEEKVAFAEATAQRFMRLAREYSNPSLVTDLGASKALVLLALPASDREEFAERKHSVNGKEKSLLEMSKRELQQVIMLERNTALEAADIARAELDNIQQYIKSSALENKNTREAMERKRLQTKREGEEAEAKLDALRKELSELQAMPTEVAIETAIQTAVATARAEAEKKLKAKIEKAEESRKNAETAKTKAEQELSAAHVAQEQADTIFRQEKEELGQQMQVLQKKLAVASSSEIAIFKLHFEQGQASINKMAESIRKMEEDGDSDGAGKLKHALSSLLQATLTAVG